MKKLLSVVALLAVLSLASCNKEEAPVSPEAGSWMEAPVDMGTSTGVEVE